MCGRFNLRTSNADLNRFFDLYFSPEFSQRYNIAPTQSILGIRVDKEGHRVASWLKWGLIPSWAKTGKDGAKLINARSDGVAEKPSFRSAFKRRRCLIPASGFYEWQAMPDKRKQPWHIHRTNNEPIALAGIWETWKADDGPVIESCSIITTDANEVMKTLHHRMPVILDSQSFKEWLDPENEEVESLKNLLVPCPDDWLTMEPVSMTVNNARNETPECLAPASEPE